MPFARALRRRLRSWRVRLALLVVGPVAFINLTVAFVGESAVFPLSPFFLEEKLHALRLYALHRPSCLFRGHPELAQAVQTAETRYRLPPGLLGALVEVESGSLAHRISPAGAMGPGQLMPGTAKQLGVADPFSPPEAIDGSARYLSAQLRRFQSIPLALAAYNAGPGAVNRTIPKNGETEFYVAKVLKEYERRTPPKREGPPKGR